jgi:predicted alpha/beta-hydrolase family hydrolase
VDAIDIPTAHGEARAHMQTAPDARGALILGHGAGGGVGAPDLQAAAAVALDRHLGVALIEQPYRRAGRRAPAPAAQLDAAWTTVASELTEDVFRGLPLLVGGRSLGARVACRSAAALDAVGVLCLAFPLVPPRRARSTRVPQSRLGELEAVAVPTLVVQGRRDQFGVPPSGPHRQVVEVNGDHSLRSDLPAVRDAVGRWFDRLTTLG